MKLIALNLTLFFGLTIGACEPPSGGFLPPSESNTGNNKNGAESHGVPSLKEDGVELAFHLRVENVGGFGYHMGAALQSQLKQKVILTDALNRTPVACKSGCHLQGPAPTNTSAKVRFAVTGSHKLESEAKNIELEVGALKATYELHKLNEYGWSGVGADVSVSTLRSFLTLAEIDVNSEGIVKVPVALRVVLKSGEVIPSAELTELSVVFKDSIAPTIAEAQHFELPSVLLAWSATNQIDPRHGTRAMLPFDFTDDVLIRDIRFFVIPPGTASDKISNWESSGNGYGCEPLFREYLENGTYCLRPMAYHTGQSLLKIVVEDVGGNVAVYDRPFVVIDPLAFEVKALNTAFGYSAESNFKAGDLTGWHSGFHITTRADEPRTELDIKNPGDAHLAVRIDTNWSATGVSECTQGVFLDESLAPISEYLEFDIAPGETQRVHVTGLGYFYVQSSADGVSRRQNFWLRIPSEPEQTACR